MNDVGRVRRIIATMMVVLMLAALTVASATCGPEEPVARSYECDVYVEQGCAKMIIASGGELEVQSGATLDVQSGADFTIGSGQTINNWFKIGAPTAVATSTPAAVVDSLAVSNILEVRDAATPVFTINNGGAWVSTGAGTHSGGQTIDNWVKAAAPTAVATSTPAMVVDSLGVSNILEVRDAATPMFTVSNGGASTFAAGGVTITAGGITLSDGDAVVADDVRVTAQTSITVTDATAFTATGTYQNLLAAGEVTPTITAGATAGDLLVLINASAQTINIADSGTAKLTAAWAAGQYDVLVLWSDGTNWIEVSRADN